MKTTKEILKYYRYATNSSIEDHKRENIKWFSEDEITQKTNKVFETWCLGSIDKELLKKELLEELFKTKNG